MVPKTQTKNKNKKQTLLDHFTRHTQTTCHSKKSSVSTISTRRCCVCQSNGTFQFKPQFPLRLKPIVETLLLDSPCHLSCPFCYQDDILRLPKGASTTTSPVTIKLEHGGLSETMFGLTKENRATISDFSASILILHHGYHPTIALKALLQHPTNLLDAIDTAEILLLEQIELLQMRLIQAESQENIQRDKAYKQCIIETGLKEGNMSYFWDIVPHIMDQAVSCGTFFMEYLSEKIIESIELSILPSSFCFCGLSMDAIIPNSNIRKTINYLKDYHLTGLSKRRLDLYNLFSLHKKAIQWYQTPAILFVKAFEIEFLNRLQFLQDLIGSHLTLQDTNKSIHSNNITTPTIPIHDDYAINQTQHLTKEKNDIIGESFIYQLQVTIACTLVFQDWIEHTLHELKEGLFTPNFDDVLSIPLILKRVNQKSQMNHRYKRSTTLVTNHSRNNTCKIVIPRKKILLIKKKKEDTHPQIISQRPTTTTLLTNQEDHDLQHSANDEEIDKDDSYKSITTLDDTITSTTQLNKKTITSQETNQTQSKKHSIDNNIKFEECLPVQQASGKDYGPDNKKRLSSGVLSCCGLFINSVINDSWFMQQTFYSTEPDFSELPTDNSLYEDIVLDKEINSLPIDSVTISLD